MNRLLAAGAAILALLAVLAGERPHAPSVSAITLAEWIRERRAVRVVDVRPEQDVMLHVPTAVHTDVNDAPWDLSARDSVVTVADSDPAAELAETEVKISALRQALTG